MYDLNTTGPHHLLRQRRSNLYALGTVKRQKQYKQQDKHPIRVFGERSLKLEFILVPIYEICVGHSGSEYFWSYF